MGRRQQQQMGVDDQMQGGLPGGYVYAHAATSAAAIIPSVGAAVVMRHLRRSCCFVRALCAL